MMMTMMMGKKLVSTGKLNSHVKVVANICTKQGGQKEGLSEHKMGRGEYDKTCGQWHVFVPKKGTSTS